jgi:DNA-binding LacI/PurR family transcriptional regulator
VPSVLADQTEIGAFAGEYLVERGYRELAAVVPREQGNRRLGLGRLKGIERVAEKYRVTAHHFDMAFDAAEAAQVAQQVRALEKPIGILGYNDEYAILLMRAVEQLSLQVPREVALVGVGNRPICTLVRPQLTSVQNKTSYNIQEIANLFDALIQGRAIRKKVVSLFSPTIEVRETA